MSCKIATAGEQQNGVGDIDNSSFSCSVQVGGGGGGNKFYAKKMKTENYLPVPNSNVPINKKMDPPHNGMTIEQEISMQKSLQNPLVLHKIIKMLDFPDLKLCRLVTPSWHKICSEFMKKSDLCQLQILFDKKRRTYRRTTIENLKSDSKSFYPEPIPGCYNLEVLVKILENSHTTAAADFPCTDYLFQYGNMESPDCQKFFNVFGPQIKTLHLFGNSTTPRSTFQKILTCQAPHVTHLTLSGFTYEWPEDVNYELPALKIFEWCYSTGTNLKVLKAAINLETVQNFLFCDNPDLVINTGKIDRLKQLNCQVKDKPVTWQKLVGAGLKLKKLTFRVQTGNSELNEIFQKFLNVSNDSLEFLELSQVCWQYKVGLPVLKNLKVLEMGFNSGTPCFPRGLDLAKTFPNLTTLDCTGLLCHVDSTWAQYFPPPDAFRGDLKTVNRLLVGDDWTRGWLQSMAIICQNLTTLIVQCQDDGPEGVLKCVNEFWPKLKKLRVKFHNLMTSEEDGDEQQRFCMDSILTGMDQEICDQIRALGPNSVVDKNFFETVRTGPFIGQLRDLSTLQITILCPIKNEQSFPLSFVGGIYGLRLLPDLKTRIAFDHEIMSSDHLKRLYMELTDFANIGHIKYHSVPGQ